MAHEQPLLAVSTVGELPPLPVVVPVMPPAPGAPPLAEPPLETTLLPPVPVGG